jgi:hypothetical protein
LYSLFIVVLLSWKLTARERKAEHIYRTQITLKEIVGRYVTLKLSSCEPNALGDLLDSDTSGNRTSTQRSAGSN